MAITPLPTPPSRNDPSTFSTLADAFLGALPAFATEANALATATNLNETNSAASAVTCTTKAAEAAASSAAAELAATEAVSLTESYQGSLSSDPLLDKNGNSLSAGDWYVNTTSSTIRAYTGSAWVVGITSIAGVSSLNGMTGDIVFSHVLHEFNLSQGVI